MHRKNSTLLWFASAGLVLLTVVTSAVAGDVAPKTKPMIPARITVESTAPQMKPQNIRPGDVVTLAVKAPGVRGADETAVKITLLDGAELVSGDLAWSGKLSPRDTKELDIAVRAPASGIGRVVAQVSGVRNGKVFMSKEIVYTLGPDGFSVKGKPAHGMRKDSGGRTVVEY